MSSISLLLLSVHKNVHDFPMKMNYSEPKMYTGGVDISKWSKLTTVHQNRALQADWYIYYSFRDPFAGKLKRQPNIKAGANKFKNKKERFQFLKSMKNNLSMLLQSGFNPYEYDKKLEQDFKNLNSSFKDDVITSNIEFDKKTISKNEIDIPPYPIVVDTTISEAFQLALGIKKSVLAESSYPKFKSRINRCKKRT